MHLHLRDSTFTCLRTMLNPRAFVWSSDSVNYCQLQLDYSFLPLSIIVIFNLIEVFFHFQRNCHLQLDCSFLQLSIIVMFNLIVGPVGGPRPWLPLKVGSRSRPAKNPLHRKCQHLQPPSFHIPYHICRYYLVVHICPVTKGPFL